MKLRKRELLHQCISVIMVVVMVLGLCAFVECEGEQVSAADTAFEKSINGFPGSYKSYLRTLHAKYPNWKFVPYNTGIDFSTAVQKEYENNRSLIENSFDKYLKSNATADYNVKTGKYIAKDGGSWVSASKNAIAHFMDPRNFLNTEQIYMFEQLSYDASTQTQNGVEAILAGSFMYKTNIGYVDTAGKYKTSNILYSKQILDAAKTTKVSAYYIASKIVQEIGRNKNSKYAGMGASGSISGTYSNKYKGIYNFYNIGAYSGANPIANGLEWASSGKTYQRPWNTPFKSIVGGAEYIGEKYINAGQNTTYFQRFNVNKNSKYNLYEHQYMTNIYGAASEASLTSEAYSRLGITALAKTFVIPVYNNMPNKSTTVLLGAKTSKTGKILSTVNVRKSPSTNDSVLITLNKNDTVTVLKGVVSNATFGSRWLSNPYWYQIQVKRNNKTYSGYIAAAYVSLDTEYHLTKGVKTKLPLSVSSKETVYYMSDNPAIATVDNSGYVTGKKDGNVTIRVFTQGGQMSTTTVSVSSKGCVFNIISKTLKVGGKTTLKATVYPTNATNKTVTFTSGNPKVAKVSKKGKITAVSAGTAVISGKAAVGGVVATCTVKVIPKTPVVKGKGKKRAVKLTWAKTSKISGYYIYRKTGKGKYKTVAKIKGTKSSYKDKKLKKGKKYTYQIKAYTLVGRKKYKSKRSKAITVKAK